MDATQSNKIVRSCIENLPKKDLMTVPMCAFQLPYFKATSIIWHCSTVNKLVLTLADVLHNPAPFGDFSYVIETRS